MEPDNAGYPHATTGAIDWIALAADANVGAAWRTLFGLAWSADERGRVEVDRSYLASHYGDPLTVQQIGRHIKFLEEEGWLCVVHMGAGSRRGVVQLRQPDPQLDGIGAKGHRRIGACARPVSISNKDIDTDTELVTNTPRPFAAMHRMHYDALVTAFGQPESSRARARYGKVAKEFVQDELDPAEVPRRAEVLRRRWGRGVDVTPEALAKHWSTAVPKAPRQTFGNPRSGLEAS